MMGVKHFNLSEQRNAKKYTALDNGNELPQNTKEEK